MTTRKENILQISANLFRKKGYKATSMRTIAEAVGMQAASMYNHIKSKQQILEMLLMSMAEHFTEGMIVIKHTERTAEEKLEQLIKLHVKLTIEHTDAIALIAAEWVHLEEPARSEYLKLRTQYERDFKAILEQGKQEGLFKNIDTEIMLFSTLSTLRWLYSWYSRNPTYNVTKLQEHITDCLISGIKT